MRECIGSRPVTTTKASNTRWQRGRLQRFAKRSGAGSNPARVSRISLLQRTSCVFKPYPSRTIRTAFHRRSCHASRIFFEVLYRVRGCCFTSTTAGNRQAEYGGQDAGGGHPFHRISPGQIHRACPRFVCAQTLAAAICHKQSVRSSGVEHRFPMPDVACSTHAGWSSASLHFKLFRIVFRARSCRPGHGPLSLDFSLYFLLTMRHR